jgi:hypothetical protein
VPNRRFENISARKTRESTTQDGTLRVEFSIGDSISIKNCIWVFDDSVTRNIRRGSNLWSQILDLPSSGEALVSGEILVSNNSRYRDLDFLAIDALFETLAMGIPEFCVNFTSIRPRN